MTTQDVTDRREISLAYLPATQRQRRVVFFIAALLLAAFGVAAPFGGAKLPQFVSFNPAVQSIVFVTDLITAIFLFAQYQINASRALLALAIGYLYSAFIVVPYTLAYPGAFTGLLNTGPQSSAWLYYFWIDGIPAGAIAYALLVIADRKASSTERSARFTIFWSVLLVVGLVYGITWICTTGSWLLPPMMDGNRYTYVVTQICTPLSILMVVIAIALLWSLRQSILDYWLMLVMLSLLLNHVIADFLGGERYSLGFYASRGFTIVTSTLVLMLLMKEVTNLYVRLANANTMLERERGNRLMNVEATTAAIAHEIKQPLAAMALNAEASLEFLEQALPDLPGAKEALKDIIADGHRTSDALDGMRALFRTVNEGRQFVDMNEIALNVLHALGGELNDHGVTTLTELTSELPLIHGNRGQLQQVIFNLVHNAIEAMCGTTDRSRVLRLVSQRQDSDAIVIAVQDTGAGIAPEHMDRVFDAFVTTKSQGTGLGLAICRVIIERHGGQLSAFSDGKSGTLFQFVLPIKPPEEAAARG
jgi:signal transduction histidine kinase